MFRILDLFCGCGGMSAGFDSLNAFETRIGIDINVHAIKTFRHNFPNSITLDADLTDKNSKNKIIELSKQNNINMIIGGPPCQGFSLKGKKRGLNDPRNFLFVEYLDLVKNISPDIFVIENVKELLSSADGFFIQEIKKVCESMDYTITYGILDAIHFEVPQNRKRAIIIGSRNKKINLPKTTPNTIKTVKDAISDLNFLSSGEGAFKQRHKFSSKSIYQDLLRDTDILYNHVATDHSQVALQKLYLIPSEKGKEYLPEYMHGRQKFSTTWGRLEWNKPSPTIDTRFDTPSNGKNSHPELHRSITIREAARIQSFKDSFVFLGNKTEICKQVGNAVPPLLAKAIGVQIVKQLSN